MKDSYAVVQWESDNSFPHLKVSKILYSKEEVTDKTMLINGLWKIEYENGKFQKGTVLQIGSRAKMSQLAADKAEEVANKSMQEKDDDYMEKSKHDRKKKAKRKLEEMDNTFMYKKKKQNLKQENLERNSEQVLEDLRANMSSHVSQNALNLEVQGISELNSSIVFGEDEILGIDVDPFIPSTDQTSESDEPKNLLEPNCESPEIRIKLLESKLKRANREKRRLLKQLNDIQGNVETPMEKINLGNNIEVSKGVIKDIKSDYRYQPSKFLRAMMYKTGLFSIEEVAASSVTGQKCRDGQRPPLDPAKFTAVKDYTIKVCKIKPNTLVYNQFKHCIRDICTDARKMLKKSPK